MTPQVLLERYHASRSAYDGGHLSEAAFVAECEALMAQDDDGTWWSVDTSGQLLRYDDAQGDWHAHVAPASPLEYAAPTATRADRARSVEQAQSAPPPVMATPSGDAAHSAPELGPATNPIAPLIGLGIVFVASLFVSLGGWDLLGAVPEAINGMIPVGNCSSLSVGTVAMYLCSAFVGLRVVFGSLVLAVALIMLRKPIGAVIGLINMAMPANLKAVLPAIVAAAFFAIVWAGSHLETGDEWGLLPHAAFPAIVGAFVFATMSFGPAFMARFSTFFDARDRLSTGMRWFIVFATPTLVSFVITFEDRVSNEGLKQQIVVLIGMAVGVIVMTPRSGKLADLRHTIGRAKQ